MLIFTHCNDPGLERIPPEYRPATVQAIKTLRSIPTTDTPFNAEVQGCVVFVETDDRPDGLYPAIKRDLDCSLEGVTRESCCLVGVIIWGNSGDGVAIVCPNKKDYAPEIVQILKNHL